MNCNLKWQAAHERGTARTAKAFSSRLPEPTEPADAADDADMQDDADDEEAGKSERRSKPDANGNVMRKD